MNNKKGASRRDIITANFVSQTDSNASAEQDAESNSLDSVASHEKHKQLYFEKYSKNAMACQFELLFNMHQYENAAASALEAFKLIDTYEDQMSIYREESELSQINRNAYGSTISIEPELNAVLRLAKSLFEQTNGAFDISSTPLSDVWGFSRRDGKVPDDAEIQKALTRVSSNHFEISDEPAVRFNADIRLNLGGIGKGFAIDHAASHLEESQIADFVIHGGQSSVAARGHCIDNDGSVADGWNVGLSHPLIPNRRLAEIRLINQSLGTSGTGRQGFFYRGKRYGHIIDPRTGYPTEHFLSSTVICKSAARADALATAFFVMSLQDVQNFCDQNKDIKCILVVASDNPTNPTIESFNLNDDELLVLD